MRKRLKRITSKSGILSFVFIFLALFISCNISYAATAEELMHDSLARGYMAGKGNDKAGAEKYFREAFGYAKKAESWNGMIDSGMGLLVLGKHRDAMKFLEAAGKIINKNNDWRGKVALGYIYISLPQDFIDKEKASSCFEDARKYALKKRDWRGLAEAGKGFLEIGAEDKAIACLDSAMEIAKGLKSIEGMKEVGKYYKKAGQAEKSRQAVNLIKSFKDEFKEVRLPPEWWEPTGKTVAGPKKIENRAQEAERESADKEIEAAYAYQLELRKKDAEYKSYYLNYNNYYGYPYYYNYYYDYTYWANNPWDTSLSRWWLYDWCNYYIRGYRYSDNFYFYAGW